MDPQDLERIARLALRELGAGDAPLAVFADTPADRWRVEVGGAIQTTLRIKAGAGTSAQFIRDQIFEQYGR